MPELIAELKRQHATLKSALLELKRTTNREDQLMLLQSIKEGLLKHLALEDAKLYPFLREQAKDDPELAKMLELFDEDMKEVTGVVQNFFVVYEGGWENDYEFLMDLAEVTTRLARRIEIEEKHLYPEYLARKKSPQRKLKGGILARIAKLFGRS